MAYLSFEVSLPILKVRKDAGRMFPDVPLDLSQAVYLIYDTTRLSVNHGRDS